jgi:hypothetical protein
MVRWRPRIEGTCGSTHVAYAAACSRIAGSYTWWLARPDRPHVKPGRTHRQLSLRLSHSTTDYHGCNVAAIWVRQFLGHLKANRQASDGRLVTRRPRAQPISSILGLVHNGVEEEGVQRTRRDPLSRMTSDPRSPSSLSKLHRHCDGQFSDANRRSDAVGCCRSDFSVCIQKSIPDGSCRVTYAFWKCGWWGNPPRGFESLSLRVALMG